MREVSDSREILPFEMCSRTEADRRQANKTLSIYEMQPNSNLVRKPSYQSVWVIKEYTRSAAGLDQSADIRPGPALSRTLEYLILNVLDVDRVNPRQYTNPPNSPVHHFIDIYNFVNNRARAVIKDYKIAGETRSEGYIQDLERLTRFHILAVLEGQPYPDFDAELNLERLEDVLFSLEDAYRETQERDHPNEGEFLAYKLVLHIDNLSSIHKWIKESPAHLRLHPLTQFALRVIRSYHWRNYVSFFRLTNTSSFLTLALLSLSFDAVRLCALNGMRRSFKDAIPLIEMRKILGFCNTEEAEEYLQLRGAQIIRSAEGELVSLKSQIIEKKVSIRTTGMGSRGLLWRRDIVLGLAPSE